MAGGAAGSSPGAGDCSHDSNASETGRITRNSSQEVARMAGTRGPRSGTVVAVSEDSIPEDHFLGRIATYTLPDEPRSGAKLLRSWAKNGLDVDDLPEARQPVHVFQSACASVRSRRAPGSNGHRIEITADEIKNTAASCAYQITSKVWDTARDVIEHEKGMRITFDKHTNEITVDELDGYDQRLRAVEGRIREDFDANAKTVPGQKIRNALRAQIHKVGGQNLRRKAGGLYFVPAEYAIADGNGSTKATPTKPVLDGLAGVLADLYGEDADFYTIPLVNDEGQRQMVRKHFVINANEQARELAERAINRVRAGKGQRAVRTELLTNMWNERRRLMGAIEQFEQLVGLEMQDLEANVKDLDRALEELDKFAEESRA